MSETLSVPGQASTADRVTVSQSGPRGMISVRCDLGGSKLAAAMSKLAGVDIPEPGGINLKGPNGLAWMSPDELLVLGSYENAVTDAETLRKALHGTHHLVANVSDARAVFRLEGALVREVLAKLTPADVSPAGFGPGQIRRSRLAQVAGAFWMPDATTAEVVCFRSVGVYMLELLTNAARPGAEVRFF